MLVPSHCGCGHNYCKKCEKKEINPPMADYDLICCKCGIKKTILGDFRIGPEPM